MQLWDTKTGEHQRTLKHTGAAGSASFSPDGRTLASRSGGQVYSEVEVNAVHLWDAVTGEHKRTLTGHTSWIRSVAFSPDGRTLASGSWDGTVLLWKLFQ